MVEERGEPSPSSSALRLSVRVPAPVTRFPGAAPGACFAGPRFPRPPLFAPPTPPPVARPCSSASSLLLRGLTSRARASSATALRLPDADRSGHVPSDGPEISRFPYEERPHMPGSQTTPGRAGARAGAPARVAFRIRYRVGTRDEKSFAAQWPACMLPCRRFTACLAADSARLG